MAPFQRLSGNAVSPLPSLVVALVVGGAAIACNLSDPVSSNDAGASDARSIPRCEGWVVTDGAGEVCDDVDNDCDGVADEGCDCAYRNSSKGVCANGTIGSEGDCRSPSNFEADESSCDQVDNDCDGVTDEGCSCAFRGEDTGVCTDSTRGPDGACAQPELWEAQETSCDDVDNDCDGDVDENCNCVPGEVERCYGGPQGTEGVGICKAGSRECGTDGTWKTCSGAVRPEDEQCADTTDNDCDGEVDENCTCDYRGRAQGVCADSTVQSDGSCREPNAYESSESSCADGVDNDCDGSADLDDSDCARRAGASCSGDGDCISNICDGGTCAHRLFVTPSTTAGDFGGLSAADNICSSAASNAGLRGNWRAIVSVQGNPAKNRLRIAGPIFNMTGQKFADGPNSLWSSSHPNPPNFDAEKNAVDGSVWSGTNFRGETTASRNCNDWTVGNSSQNASIGWTDATDNAWIHAGGFAKSCSRQFHLYCIDGQ